jgi:hypothetical protein
MWLVGVLFLIASAAAVVARLGRSRRPDATVLPWDISGLAGPYTGVVGTLAGFGVASAIFIANLSLARESPTFAAIIGMPLVSFLILVISAMVYSSTPNAVADGEDDPDAAVQRLSHLLGNTSYYLGLSVGWLALPPLLEALRLPDLAAGFVWLLLVALVVGGARLTILIYRLTAAPAAACLALPNVGFALPALYRVVAARAAPSLWPAGDGALPLAFVAFGVAVLGLACSPHYCWPTGTDRPENGSSGTGTGPPWPTSRRSSPSLASPGLRWPVSRDRHRPGMRASAAIGTSATNTS